MTIEALTFAKPLTIKDIARLAGVSKTAVSGVLNKKPRVGKAKQAKILETMRKYNYVPQVSARALSTRRTYQIGFLVSSRVTLGLSNAYFSTIESGVSEACKKYDYQMLVSTYDLSDIKRFVMPHKLKQRSVDALIVAGTVSQEVLAELKLQNIPFIVIGGDYDDHDVLCLRTDMQTTYAKVIEYMVDYGHHAFCYASSEQVVNCSFKAAMSRVQAITSQELKIQYEFFHGENEYQSGVNLAKSWIKAPKNSRFTILLSSDQICCGFLAELLRNNIKCPEEISIIACCDTFVCEWSLIPISAVSFPLAGYGYLTVNLLIDVLEGRKQVTEIKEILKNEHRPYDLIIRNTTGKAPV